MLLKTICLLIIDCYCASDSLIFERLHGVLFFERIQIKNFYLTIWSIDKEQLLTTILHLQLCYHKTDVLRHFIHKLHLDLTPNFIALIAHNKLCDLLITHICRSVNLSG